MKFDLKIDYVMRDDDKKAQVTPAQVTDSLIQGAYNSKYPNGVNAKDNRLTLKTVATIQDAITTAIANKVDTIDLELSHIEWIGEILAEWTTMPVRFASYYMRLAAHVDRLIADAKAAAEQAKKDGARKE